jgi:hypothetical protein
MFVLNQPNGVCPQTTAVWVVGTENLHGLVGKPQGLIAHQGHGLANLIGQ